MLGLLAELGIEAGKPFDPDERMTVLLTEAARQGRDEMLVTAFASDRPDRIAWPDRTWEWASLRPENGTFEREGSLDVEARDRWFIQAIIASPAMFGRAVGQGSVYWLGLRDADGTYLDGARSYRLRVPLPVPAGLFWSLTAYDAQTRSEVDADQGQAALRSLFDKLDPDGADSVDCTSAPPNLTAPRAAGSRPCRAGAGSAASASTAPSSLPSTAPGSPATSNPSPGRGNPPPRRRSTAPRPYRARGRAPAASLNPRAETVSDSGHS